MTRLTSDTYPPVMTETVNVHEAKTHLSRLLQLVERGQEVTIARAGHPIARLVPVKPPEGREVGFASGMIWIADDFDAPLPDDMLDDFER